MFVADESGQDMEMKRLSIKGSIPSKNADVPNTCPTTERKRQRVSEVCIL